jgi:putative membrane protein
MTMGYRHFQNSPGDHFGWVNGLLTLLVVAAIVAGVVLIARQWRRSAPPPAAGWSPQSPAIHELDLRYARGEVERSDYLQRRADILGGGALAAGPGTPDAPSS